MYLYVYVYVYISTYDIYTLDYSDVMVTSFCFLQFHGNFMDWFKGNLTRNHGFPDIMQRFRVNMFPSTNPMAVSSEFSMLDFHCSFLRSHAIVDFVLMSDLSPVPIGSLVQRLSQTGICLRGPQKLSNIFPMIHCWWINQWQISITDAANPRFTVNRQCLRYGTWPFCR